jgi:hypothetical protein
VVLLATVLAAAACGPASSGDSGHGFEVLFEDGAEIALTTGGPKYEGELFEYEKVLTIRPNPEVPESYLWSPQSMTMTEDGTILVSDSSAGRVAAFAPDGTYLRSFGREGEGPGEFRYAGYLEVANEILWAYDFTRYRTHAYALDGTFLRTVGVPQGAGSLMRDGLMWPLDDGRLVIFNLGTLREEESTYQRAEMRIIDPAGNVLASADTRWLPQVQRIRPSDMGDPVMVPIHLRGFSWGVLARGRGFYLMSADEPEVRVYDLDGRLDKIFRFEVPPRSVTAADRAWVIETLEERLRRALTPDESGNPRSDGRRERIWRDNPLYADPKDLWSRLYVDDKGFVWLVPIIEHDRPQELPAIVFLVLSPEGEYLGRTTAPGWSVQGHVLATEEDPDSGERFPVVYRIKPAVPGLVY